MPIAGTIAWSIIGVAGAFLPVGLAAWVLFICTGMIFGIGLLVARFLGEDLLGKTRQNNAFDRLFLLTVLMAYLVFAIAIPFFMIERTSLPLTVGILAGLMWVPFSWMIRNPQMSGSAAGANECDRSSGAIEKRSVPCAPFSLFRPSVRDCGSRLH